MGYGFRMAHDLSAPDRPVLTPDLMLRAYAAGIFPMAESRGDADLFWVDPEVRGILPLDRFHMSRSLARRIRAEPYQVRINRDFAGTVAGCADRPETWINDEIAQLCLQLHLAGYAHSVEVRDGAALIGGVYGIAIGGAFFGESMFSRRRDASKIALAYLVARLRFGGFTLFDVQFVTDHLRTLGAVEIPREDYRKRLAQSIRKPANFLAQPEPVPVQDVLHLRTQTS